MTKHLTRRTFCRAAGAALFASALGGRARAADAPYRLRVSLDTAPTHLKNVSVKDYLGKVEPRPEAGSRASCSRAPSSFRISRSARR